METEPALERIQRYVASREVFGERMVEVTRQLNEWTDLHCETPPCLMDIARFEGLRTALSPTG